MFQGTSALAVYWSHSDICRGLSSFQLSGSLYKSTLGGSPSGKVGQTNFRISSRDPRLRRVDIFRSHWSAWSARNRRNKDLERNKSWDATWVCASHLWHSLCLPCHSSSLWRRASWWRGWRWSATCWLPPPLTWRSATRSRSQLRPPTLLRGLNTDL